MEIRLSFTKMNETRQKEMDPHQTVNFYDVCLELKSKVILCNIGISCSLLG